MGVRLEEPIPVTHSLGRNIRSPSIGIPDRAFPPVLHADRTWHVSGTRKTKDAPAVFGRIPRRWNNGPAIVYVLSPEAARQPEETCHPVERAGANT